MGNYIVKYKNRGSAFGVYGTKSDYFDIKVTMKIQSGRSLNLLDDREKRKVCYIGNRVAESIFPEGVDPVGEYLDIKGSMFRVVGVFKFGSFQRNGSGPENLRAVFHLSADF